MFERRHLLAFAVLMALTVAAAAQNAPAVRPFDVTGTGQNASESVAPLEPASTPQPAAGTAQPGLSETAPSGDGAIDRYIIPFRTLRLQGEADARAWVINLSKQDIEQKAALAVRYINSIVVMPEASRLRVSINGTRVFEQPIASSTAPSVATAEIPPGVLQAGPNTIRVEAAMYHRTDCTAQATYELWTEIVPDGTGLSFAGSPPRRVRSLEDLASVGLDAEGSTSIRVLVPSGNQGQVTARLMRMVQAVALRGRYPHPIVKVFDDAADLPPAGPGSLTMVLGTAADLPGMLASPPAEAALRPSVSFSDDMRLGGSVITVSGPSWADVGTAVETLMAGVDRPVNVTRTNLDTSAWMAPAVPFFTSGHSVRLADAGVPTQEFGGRVFRTRFALGVPADFYANAYGTATLYLDAAYGATVLPASHFDLYVNGSLASTLTLTNEKGRIYRHFPLEIPLRHFKPGVNQLVAEVVLMTAKDAACAPGATIPGDSRFVLLDSTEINIPSFARIGRRPDLAALSGTGFPYNRSLDPVSLILGRQDVATYSAAATLIARMAQIAGRPVPLDTAASPGKAASQHALFVGAIGQMPPGLLTQLGIAEEAAATWRTTDVQKVPNAVSDPYASALETYQRSLRTGDNPRGAEPREGTTDTAAVFDRWREDLSDGGGLRGKWASFRQWLERKFEISDQSLGIAVGKEPPYAPPSAASLLVAQARSPLGSGTWTMFAAPTTDALVNAAAEVTAPTMWSQIAGRISTFEILTGRVRSQPARVFEFVPTQPLSASNARLIAANWLSGNTVYYASGLLLLCTLLGAYTFSFLGRLGRQS